MKKSLSGIGSFLILFASFALESKAYDEQKTLQALIDLSNGKSISQIEKKVHKSGIDPVKWTPSKSVGRKGVFKPNHELALVERAKTLFGDGPETIAISPDGAIYTGLRNGKVIRFQNWQSVPTVYGDTGGKPLGIKFHPNGDLIIADAKLGLLAMNTKGEVRILANSYQNKKFLFVNDVAISSTGMIYFTDTSTRWTLEQSESEFIEHRSTGRIFSYNPLKGQSSLKLISSHLDYPNGLSFGPGEEYLVVSETTSYRITRLWLKGARAGSTDVLIDGLPGIPTGISFNGTDRFWFGIASPRIGILDTLAKLPLLRRLLPLIPKKLKPKPILMAWAVAIDLEGKVIASYEDEASDSFAGVTSVLEHEGMIYLGGGFETSPQNGIGRYNLAF